MSESASVEVEDFESLSDNALMERVARLRDQESFRILYERIAPSLFFEARRLCRDPNDAEDAVIATMFRVWERAQLFDPERGQFSDWARVILRYRAMDTFRGNARWHAVGLEKAASVEAPTTFDRAELAYVAKLVKALKDEDRAIIEAFYLREQTVAELASSLGISTGTVRVRLHRAIRRLRASIEAPTATRQ